MGRETITAVHLVCGGFPPGEPAAHDIDYARRRLLGFLAEQESARTSVASDLADIERWLERSRFVITYLSGPHLDEAQSRAMRAWLEGGGRWLGLHGTSGGRAVSVGGDRRVRRMQKSPHHGVLGAFFLNHPPVRRFRVDVADPDHPLARGLPASFETVDELYLVELQDPEHTDLVLSTAFDEDPSPPGFGFDYERDTSPLADGRTRALAYTRTVGRGAVAYVALGHCHSAATNVQPFVDESVSPGGETPLTLRGSWENEHFETLIRNALAWGLAPR